MYRINCKKLPSLAIVLVTIFSALWAQGLPVTIGRTIGTTATTIKPDFPSWRNSLYHLHTPQRGCFTVTYPSTVWQSAHCVTAPSIPLEPTAPSTVGDGVDEVAYSGSGTLIGSSTGSFQSISGLTTETDSIEGINYYSLQINSQFFSTTTPYTGNKAATGWEQFVFINYPAYSSGFIYIQYWLVNFQSTYGSCPNIGPPGGSSWMAYSGSCYANSPGGVVPTEAASALGDLVLRAYANFNSNDEILFCISGGACYAVSPTDQVLDLYQYWLYSEFNVFGFSSGSQANFNSGTTVTVVNALEDQSGNMIVPSCVNTGYTAETNNLNLSSCSSSTTNDEILSIEHNGQPINPQASISPTSVVQRQTVTYTGSGFTPNHEATVVIDSGSGFGYVVGTPTSSSTGAISGSFVAGTNILPGTRQVTFTDTATGLATYADVTVIQLQSLEVSINQTAVTQGQPVSYTGSGFTPNGKVNVAVYSGSGNVYYLVGTPTATDSGAISGTFIAGTNILPGTQPVTFTDTSTNHFVTVDLQVQETTTTMVIRYSIHESVFGQ